MGKRRWRGSIIGLCLLLTLFFTGFCAQATDKTADITLGSGEWLALDIDEQEDILYWRITLPEDGRLDVTALVKRGDTSFSLLGDDKASSYGSFNLYGASASEPRTGSLSVYLVKGTYYFKAQDRKNDSGFGGEGEVDVKASLVSANSTENTANDSFDEAQELTSGEMVSAMLEQRANGETVDVDFYKYTVSETTTLDMKVISMCYHIGVSVYDADYSDLGQGVGTTVSASEDSPQTLTWSIADLEPGTYYFKVSAYTRGRYKIQLTDPLDTDPCADGHTWDDGVVTEEATCTEGGYLTYTCTVCGTTKFELVLSLGHDWDDGVVSREATCTEGGYTTYTCKRCNTEKYELSPAPLGHDYQWVVDAEPSCKANGLRHEECSRCKAIGAQEVIESDIEHDYEVTVIKEATSLEAGIEQYTCKNCGNSYKKDIPKLAGTVTLSVPAKKVLPLSVGQKYTVGVSGLAAGDSVSSWKSSNTNVAAVTQTGKIVGKKSGVAKITVTLESGTKTWFKVKVQKDAVSTKSITVRNASTGKKLTRKVTMAKKETIKLSVSVTPVTSKQKVTYASSNKKVVTVSKNGKIKAKNKGTATITVTSGKKKKTYKITVK